jgi:hypothetical protein
MTFSGVMKNDLTEYYAQRAPEYEAIYRKPERQADLLAAATILQEIFNNQSVLESPAAPDTGRRP